MHTYTHHTFVWWNGNGDAWFWMCLEAAWHSPSLLLEGDEATWQDSPDDNIAARSFWRGQSCWSPCLGFPPFWPYFSVSASRLPSIVKLNGSIVADGEREDSERFFIRYYMEFPEEEVPFRYEFVVLEWRTGQKKQSGKREGDQAVDVTWEIWASWSMTKTSLTPFLSCPPSVLVNAVTLERCLMTCRITLAWNSVLKCSHQVPLHNMTVHFMIFITSWPPSG